MLDDCLTDKTADDLISRCNGCFLTNFHFCRNFQAEGVYSGFLGTLSGWWLQSVSPHS